MDLAISHATASGEGTWLSLGAHAWVQVQHEAPRCSMLQVQHEAPAWACELSLDSGLGSGFGLGLGLELGLRLGAPTWEVGLDYGSSQQ